MSAFMCKNVDFGAEVFLPVNSSITVMGMHYHIKCTANTTPCVCMREKFKFDVSSMHCLVFCNHPGR